MLLPGSSFLLSEKEGGEKRRCSSCTKEGPVPYRAKKKGTARPEEREGGSDLGKFAHRIDGLMGRGGEPSQTARVLRRREMRGESRWPEGGSPEGTAVWPTTKSVVV